MNGFLDGFGGSGEPSGRVVGVRPPDRKEAKFVGVRAVASAGGGRPVNFAMSVRIQRSRVKIPSMEPSVLRKLPNCSATETMAVIVSVLSPLYQSRGCLPKNDECVAQYVLSSICAKPPNAPTMLSMV